MRQNYDNEFPLCVHYRTASQRAKQASVCARARSKDKRVLVTNTRDHFKNGQTDRAKEGERNVNQLLFWPFATLFTSSVKGIFFPRAAPHSLTRRTVITKCEEPPNEEKEIQRKKSKRTGERERERKLFRNNFVLVFLSVFFIILLTVRSPFAFIYSVLRKGANPALCRALKSTC